MDEKEEEIIKKHIAWIKIMAKNEKKSLEDFIELLHSIYLRWDEDALVSREDY